MTSSFFFFFLMIKMTTTQYPQYDNPNDIDSMDALKIKAVSGNQSPKIYANGRNQLPIEITAKALDNNSKVLNFSHETWIHILNLCFAESNDKLSWKHHSGWCFTNEENDYSREIEVASASNTLFSVRDDGTVIIIMYVYTDETETKRIAVRVDTDNKHFTTADKSEIAMSVYVTALNQFTYSMTATEALKLPTVKKFVDLGKKKNQVRYKVCSSTAGFPEECSEYKRTFDCHYDNYYISVPFGIKNANIYNYGSISGEFKWICVYNYENNNQHMIVAHPFNKKGTDLFGFENTAEWQGVAPLSVFDTHGFFDLTQSVTYNETPNAICFTQMAFDTGTEDAWQIPDGRELDTVPFGFDTWFELYDIYGNYGKFSVGFTDDNQYIKITDRP